MRDALVARSLEAKWTPTPTGSISSGSDSAVNRQAMLRQKPRTKFIFDEGKFLGQWYTKEGSLMLLRL